MSSNGARDYAWWSAGTVPAPLSIVWCNFPENLVGDPGPKPRPALVLKARYAHNPPQDKFVVFVAYGTSNMKDGRRPLDFVVANFGLRLLCRLPQATRFDLDQVLWLPWSREFFVPREADPTPVIGTLPMSAQQDFAWLMNARDQLGKNQHLK